MTFPGWISEVGPYKVEKMEGPRPGGQSYLELVPSTRRIIWHTTEGTTVAGAVARLREQFSAPHFVTGENRVVQMRPLWAQGATVRGDNSRAWQVECVAKSQTSLWLPARATLDPMVELVRWFRDRLDVPMERPAGWRDDGSDIEGIWATESNSRRLSGRATTFEGHVMHLEWPENTHWDQGALRWASVFQLAAGEDDDLSLDEYIEGQNLAQAKAVRSDGTLDDPGDVPNADWPRHQKAGWRDVRWQVNKLKGRDGAPGPRGLQGPKGDKGDPGDAAELAPGTALRVEAQ